MQHKTRTAQQQGTLKERWDFTTAVLDIVHCTPLDPWNLEMLNLISDRACSELVDLLDDIVLYQVCQFFQKRVLQSVILRELLLWNELCFEDCLVYLCLWTYFALNRFEEVESKAFIVRSLVEPVELSCPQLWPTAPWKPPEAKRRCTWRQATGTWRLRSSCCPKRPQWTPRPTMARGLKASQAAVPTEGHYASGLWRIEILEKNTLHFQQMLGKVWLSTSKYPTNANVGINDLNVTCQYVQKVGYETCLAMSRCMTRARNDFG